MSEQHCFDGMVRVVKFNWPLYAVAATSVILLLVIAELTASNHPLVQIAALLVAIGVALQTTASLVASHWIYDRPPLRDWLWLREIATGDNLNVLNIHSGYDETSDALDRVFPTSHISVIDLYPALGRREPSIIRAQKLYPPKRASLCTTIDNWPIKSESIDFVLVPFAAHELRSAEQKERLFNEARRVLRADGRIVLVEHLRDTANFFAFNLGFVHFFPRSEWLRATNAANLKLVKEDKITPFVGIFILCR